MAALEDRMRHLALPLLLALVACGGDSDGDGLSNKLEKQFLSDPNVADTDGDGLTDLEEFEAGSSPLLADTDGDTYLDLWEVNEGTDPNNNESRIYRGYWPYNPDKSNLVDAGFGSVANVGGAVGRVQAVDQFGDIVDMWDFAGQGKPVIVDISAAWCPPCNAMSSWISGGADSYNLESAYAPVRAAVDSGDVLWVTMLIEDNNYAQATQATVEQWDERYPHDRIPVIAATGDLMGQLQQSGLPNMHTLDENAILVYRNDNQSQYLDYVAMERALAMVQ